MQKLRQKTYNLLRWSEKYTKTDMVYLTKGGFWLTFAYIIFLSSGFILTIAFANLLPKDVFGTYKFVISISGVLLVTSLTGINSTLKQSI